MSQSDFSRRQLILAAGSTLTGAAIGAHISFPDQAFARAPFAPPTPVGHYNFKHGEFQISVVSDGPFLVGDGRKLMKEIPVEEMNKHLDANFLALDNMVLEQNVAVVNTGSKLVVIDTGMGYSKMFGETQGRLPRNLLAAGIDPADVDVVILSHCHPDHAGGLVDANGKSVFSNAQIFVNETDYKFWTDEAKLANEALKPLAEHARANLLPHKDKITFIKGGQEIVTGIAAMDAPGHTPGHTIFTVTSGGKPLAITADCGHHSVLMVETPKIEFFLDIDPKQAVQTRLKVWDMLATDKIPFVAYHFPWPGLGNLTKTGADTFRFFPTQISTL